MAGSWASGRHTTYMILTNDQLAPSKITPHLHGGRKTTLIETWPQNTNSKFIDRGAKLTSATRKCGRIRVSVGMTLCCVRLYNMNLIPFYLTAKLKI